MFWNRAAIVLLFTLTLSAAADEPKNIILFVGDGVGLAHLTAAKHNRGANFAIGRMPVVGLVTTQCADHTVTDSAAAATALATGMKVNYEAVSLDPNGVVLKTVLEVAEANGKLTGLVTTAQFFDATPAAFAAHAKHRGELADIAKQMLRSGADVIAGAGLKSFAKPEFADVMPIAKEQGYAVATTRAELEAIPAGAKKVLGLFPEQTRDVDNPETPLPLLAQWAIDRLRGGAKGFFLLVEHEGTDSSSHQNNVPDVTASLVSFDTAVAAALDFAAKSGNTLVIVTGDHETGSLRISETKAARIRLEWATTDHTGTAVPVFAFGPGAEAFAGFRDNTDIGKTLLRLVQLP